VLASITAFEHKNGLLGNLIVDALFPWFVAVMLTMDTAPKLNLDSGDPLKGAPRWVRASIILVLFSVSPFVFIVDALGTLGRGVNLLFRKVGFNLASKIGSLKLRIVLTILTIAVVSWLTKIL
jgi:hypothetical protein